MTHKSLESGSQSRRVLRGEIVTLGDELNRGEIIDSNAAWIGEQLTQLGIHVRFRQGANDHHGEILGALRLAASRSDVVIVSGGLGPTTDDLTVDVAASLLGVQPVLEPAHESRMRARFAARQVTPSPNNLRQVRVPAGATVLANGVGMAPGFQLEHPLAADGVGAEHRAQLFFLPGVPREMKQIFTDEALPRLRALVGTQAGRRAVVAARVYRSLGLGESAVDDRLAGLLKSVDVLEAAPLGSQAIQTADVDGAAASPVATVHYRIAFPEVIVTVRIYAGDTAQAQAALARLDPELRRRLGPALYSHDDAELPIVLGRELQARGATLVTAESCTGGMIGQLMTAVAGSSAYFLGGVIAYANEVKMQVLGVHSQTLEAHGAVSEATVIQMAEGARRLLGSTYAVAVSGVAGPGGGSPEKPVGTVHLAVAGPEGTVTRKIFYPGDREQVRRATAFSALNLVHKVLFPERMNDAEMRL